MTGTHNGDRRDIVTETTALATRPNRASDVLDITDVATILERAILGGDLSQMKPEDRLRYYNKVCESLRMNPLTKPFQYVTLRSGGPLILYPTMEAAQQLRKMYGVSCVVLSAKRDADDIYVVTVLATLPSGRRETSTGQVFVGGKRGQELADLKMKAETKAKRRATFAILGLGFFDEIEAGGRMRAVSVEEVHGLPPPTEPVAPTVPNEVPADEAEDRAIDQDTGEVLAEHNAGLAQDDGADRAAPAAGPPVEANIPRAWREVYDKRVVVAQELNEGAGKILVVIPPYPQSRAEMQRQGQGLAVQIEVARRHLAEVR